MFSSILVHIWGLRMKFIMRGETLDFHCLGFRVKSIVVHVCWTRKIRWGNSQVRMWQRKDFKTWIIVKTCSEKKNESLVWCLSYPRETLWPHVFLTISLLSNFRTSQCIYFRRFLRCVIYTSTVSNLTCPQTYSTVPTNWMSRFRLETTELVTKTSFFLVYNWHKLIF